MWAVNFIGPVSSHENATGVVIAHHGKPQTLLRSFNRQARFHPSDLVKPKAKKSAENEDQKLTQLAAMFGLKDNRGKRG